MYEKFLKQTEDFIFIDDKPEKADVIFVPGNGYPQMAEKAAELYRRGLAPRVLPSGRYSVTVGKFAGVLDREEYYNGDYETEWDFLKDVLIKNGEKIRQLLLMKMQSIPDRSQTENTWISKRRFSAVNPVTQEGH